jgi:putative peptide zinc metalloprotease protein
MELRPKFRKDLVILEHVESDSNHVVILKDPVSEKFYRMSPYEYQFLKNFDGRITFDEVLKQFRSSGYYCSQEEGKLILAKAAQSGLLLGTMYGTAEFQRDLKKRAEEAKKAKRFSNLYFFFVPILNPDRFLERTLWLYKMVANKWTGILSVVLGIGAMYLLISGMSRIEANYSFFFNLENMAYLWVTIAVTKLVHEFAHAYTAKRFGLHVPRMGIAILIFFPCLYCDTTDAWQLADRKQRMAIAAAGILAEAMVAIVAIYIWQLTKEGLVNSLAFYLMAVSFISTILFNGNPLMKFDGYFLLIDYLEIPNLRSKSLGYLKYLFMNRVLGLDRVTDQAIDKRQRYIFTIFGISSFLYLLSLYAGIAVSVYCRFDQTLGILLGGMAVFLFIIRPTVKGAKTVYSNRRDIRPRPMGISVFLMIAVAVIIPLFIPLSTKSVYPCYVTSAHVQKLTVPLHTSVAQVRVKQWTFVKKGTVLFELDTHFLDLSLVKAELERDVLRKQLDLLLLDAKEKGKAPGKQVEILKAEDQIRRIRYELSIARGGITAPFDGVVTVLDYRQQPGFQPGEGAVVGELASPYHCMIHALIPEKDRHTVSIGLNVDIWLPVGDGLFLSKKIESIKGYSERDLRDSPFSSRLGGELATETKDTQQKDVPLEAQYKCSVSLPNPDLTMHLGLTGKFAVPSPPRSIILRFLDRVIHAFNRETLV